MTNLEKERLVLELINNVQRDIGKELDQTPEEWDGVELRWFVRDHFSHVVFGGFTDMRSKRAKDYTNHCMIHNIG